MYIVDVNARKETKVKLDKRVFCRYLLFITVFFILLCENIYGQPAHSFIYHFPLRIKTAMLIDFQYR